jgi:2-dehydropantoate 2-reductase
MSRVAVIGPGSVGCFFAAHLVHTDHEVVSCARRPFDVYVVDSELAPITGPAHVVTDPTELTDGPYDWVLVGVKAHQSADAAPWFDATCGPDTVVVAMQNGVEAVERLAPLVHGARIVPAVVYCGSELIAPGHIHHTSAGRLIVPDDADGHALAELYDGTAVVIDPSDRHLTSAWVKLSINVVVNGLTALTRRPMDVLAEPELAPVAAALLAETWAVGVAEGADLDTADPSGFVTRLARAAGSGKTSMLMDTLAGRPTEHDAIHGAVARAARRHGTATPVLDTVLGLLATREPSASA